MRVFAVYSTINIPVNIHPRVYNPIKHCIRFKRLHLQCLQATLRLSGIPAARRRVHTGSYFCPGPILAHLPKYH